MNHTVKNRCKHTFFVEINIFFLPPPYTHHLNSTNNKPIKCPWHVSECSTDNTIDHGSSKAYTNHNLVLKLKNMAYLLLCNKDTLITFSHKTNPLTWQILPQL